MQTDEFERLLQQRERMWQSTINALAESVSMIGPGNDPMAASNSFHMQQLMGRVEEQQREPLREMRDQDDLIGAARFYGIQFPERIPVPELAEMVQMRRSLMQDMDEGIQGVGDKIYGIASRAIGLGLLGAGQESLRFFQNAAERIPFMRDAIVRSERMREMDRWFSTMEEGFSGDLPDRQRELAKGVAGAVGMFPGAILTWNALGLLGLAPKAAMAGGRITAMGRAMLRGGLTEVVLQDPTAPLYEQGINAAAGAAFGLGDVGGVLGRTVTGVGMGAIAGALAGEGDDQTTAISALLGGLVANVPGMLAGKVNRAFPSRVLDMASLRNSTRRQLAENIPEAKWQFLDPLAEVGAGPPTGLPGGDLVYPGGSAPAALPPGVVPMGGTVERGIGLPGQVQERVWITPAVQTIPEPSLEASFMQEAMGTGPILQRSPSIVAEIDPALEATNLTKQTSIIESPALAPISTQAAIDDADVALALVESYPGQVGVIQNVADVTSTIRRFLMDQMPNGIGPQDFRIVERPVVPVALKQLKGSSFRFGAVTPTGSHLVGLANLDEATNNLDIAMLGVLGEGTWQPVATSSPGTAWTRRAMAELTHQLGERGFPVAGISGTRNTGARAGLPIEQSQAFISTERLRRATTTDLLVSSGRAITNKMVKEYETFGMFAGQRARLHTGQNVVIEQLGEEFSTVRPEYGGPAGEVLTAHILPQKSSFITGDLPELYIDYSDFAQRRLNEQAVGIGSLPIPLMSNEGLTQAPLLMDEFLQSLQINPESPYGMALKQQMEVRHIEALRELAPPEERAMTRAIQQAVAETEPKHLLPTIQELAAARGFDYSDVDLEQVPFEGQAPAWFMEAPEWNWQRHFDYVDANRELDPANEIRSRGAELIDVMSEGDVRIPVRNQDEAIEFLHNFRRESIDDSPVGPVPLEVIEQPVGFSMEGGRDPGVYANAEEWADAVNALPDNFDEDLADLYARLGEDFFSAEGRPPTQPSDGGIPPVPPPLPPAGGSAGFFPGQPPGSRFDEAFRTARESNKFKLTQALEKLNGVVSRWFTPTRNLAIRFDTLFKDLGIPPIERMIVRMQDAHTQMVNQAHPWESAARDALVNVRQRLIRDGSVWEVLIAPREFRDSIMRTLQFTTEEKVAIQELDLLFTRFRNDVAIHTYPDLPENYLHMFQRVEERLPGDRIRRPKEATWGPSKAQESPDFVEKDMEAIVARYFRSFYKTVYMNEPYAELKALARGRNVPDAVKEFIGGWTDDRMWGLDPTKDIMLNATHSMLDTLARVFGQRVSRSEVQGLFHAEMTASYAAGLGARPDAIIRDMPQALIGITRVGLDKGLPIFKKFMDRDYRAAAMELAYEKGWLSRGHGLAVDPDLFGGTAFREVNPEIPTSITQTRLATTISDFFKDRVLGPLGLRHGWQGTKLDPLRAYGWQADWAKLWNLMTGYETAWDALRKYETSRASREFSTSALEQQLLNDARVARYQGTIQDGFIEFVRAGDYEGAASYFARHVGDSQNRFGMTEHPAGFRGWGPVTGRKAMKWLTYASQMMAEFGQILADPRISVPNKAAYLGQISALQGMYAISSRLTGWNMMKLSLTGIGFTFAGTSIFDHVNAVQRGLAYWQQLDPTSELDPTQNALIARGLTDYGSRFFTLDPSRATWNPWSGAIRTAQGFAESAPFGSEAMFRFGVTGERGDPWASRLQQGQYTGASDDLGSPWYGQQIPGGGAR